MLDQPLILLKLEKGANMLITEVQSVSNVTTHSTVIIRLYFHLTEFDLEILIKLGTTCLKLVVECRLKFCLNQKIYKVLKNKNWLLMRQNVRHIREIIIMEFHLIWSLGKFLWALIRVICFFRYFFPPSKNCSFQLLSGCRLPWSLCTLLERIPQPFSIILRTREIAGQSSLLFWVTDSLIIPGGCVGALSCWKSAQPSAVSSKVFSMLVLLIQAHSTCGRAGFCHGPSWT